MDFKYDDGGRASAGYKGNAGDCVVRAIAIATQIPYQEVYDAINTLAQKERPRRGRKRSSARGGVGRKTSDAFLKSLGWIWTPTMSIGSGCKVHLLAEELPAGRLIVRVSKHVTTVIDGVIHDTYNPQRGPVAYMKAGRDGIAIVDHISPERCVYGYWSAPEAGRGDANDTASDRS